MFLFLSSLDASDDPSDAENTRLSRWKDVTVEEIKVFLGLVLLTGLVKKPKVEDYWSFNEAMDTPFFRRYMSRNRFQAILSNFHLVENRNAPKRGRPGFDPLYKVRPMVSMCEKNFKSSFYPAREITIDEGGVPWRGRVSFKVYNPRKPNKFQMKFYEVCDSRTGYVYCFEIYTGKGSGNQDNVDTIDPTATSITQLVVRLLAKGNLLDVGHHLYMDNYYTSPELLEELHFRDTYACGTVRKGRKGLPLAVTNADLKKTGQVVFRRSDKGLLALRWRDKRVVYMLSTIHDATEQVVKVDHQGVERVKPTAVQEYTQYMQGVDMNDQLLSYYACSRRTVKWWKKMFFHCLDMLVTNAYILYKVNHILTSDRDLKPMPHSRFVNMLIAHLVSFSQEGAPVSDPATSAISDTRLLARHFPSLIECKTRNNQANAKRKHAARLCYICGQLASLHNDKTRRHWTTYSCKPCGKALCVGERNCFEMYHTNQDYLNGDPLIVELAYDDVEQFLQNVPNNLLVQ